MIPCLHGDAIIGGLLPRVDVHAAGAHARAALLFALGLLVVLVILQADMAASDKSKRPCKAAA